MTDITRDELAFQFYLRQMWSGLNVRRLLVTGQPFSKPLRRQTL